MDDAQFRGFCLLMGITALLMLVGLVITLVRAC